MIRRTTWLARLLSVATGPLILGGCATQTVVFDPATGPAGISAQPGRSGLVIAAPHGTSDGRTADIAADLGRRTGFGIVIATGFAIEPDTRERAGRRDQVNRPTEGVPGRPPAEEVPTDCAREVYDAYEARVREVARGPLRFLAEIHGNNHRDAAGRIEIATVGVDRELAFRIVALLGRLKATRRGARVAVVCGKGGNGGDGFVVARWLKRSGVRPDVLLAFPEGEIGGDAGGKLRELRRSGVRSRLVEDAHAAVEALARADVIVDALLGTGSRGAPEGRVARLIELINASGRPVVALDVPSGVSADGDPPAGPAIRATLTLTFGGFKRGLVCGPGAPLAGRVEVVAIGVPAGEVLRGVATFVLAAADGASLFPPRPRDAHKGTYGHLLVVAGSLGKSGAAAFAAAAALRSGVGLVTVATPASQQPVVAGLVREAMTEPLPETGARTFALKAREVVAELAAPRDAVALGPGLGLDDETRVVARALVQETAKPMAVDADALSALAGHPEVLRAAPAARTPPPPPGELPRS